MRLLQLEIRILSVRNDKYLIFMAHDIELTITRLNGSNPARTLQINYIDI